MRHGSYSLSGLVRNEMNMDVLSGDVFIFIGRTAAKIKLLLGDNDGFALYVKRIECGSFERPATNTTICRQPGTSARRCHVLQSFCHLPFT